MVLMHADPSASLPGAKDLGDIPQMYSDRIVTKKRIRIDPAIRAERKTWTNTKFARDGFGSLPITFSESDRLLLEDLMREAAKRKGGRLHYLDDGGMENASRQSIFRLCVTFIQACASPEQILFVEKSLARKSLNISVHELGLGGASRAAAEEEGCRLRRRL